MRIKTEQHREILVHLIKAANFPGDMVEAVAELKAEINSAEIEQPAARPLEVARSRG